MRHVALVVLVSACSHTPGAWVLGSREDPVVVAAPATPTPCTPLSAPTRLLEQDFSASPTTDWINAAYGVAEFGGNWLPNGSAAELFPPSVAKPGVAVFAYYLDLCPEPAGYLTARVRVDASQYKDAMSDATLVLYYFDEAGALLHIIPTYAIRLPNARELRIDDVGIPPGTRRIAIAPMALLGATETATVRFDDLIVDYWPTTPVHTVLASEDFADASDWTGSFVSDGAALSVWNPAWSGETLPVEQTMTRTFSFDVVPTFSLELFAAATFSDPTSFIRAELTFPDGREIIGEPLRGVSYSRIDLRDVAGGSGVTVTLRASLGANETSSFYVDDLRLVATTR